MHSLIHHLIPIIVVFLMAVVGLELTSNDFRRVALYPRTVIFGTLGQMVLLPLIAAILIWTLKPAPHIAAGMLLLAACPAGAIANVYTYVARANTALSVTLTAVSSLAALITLPLVTSVGFAFFFDQLTVIKVPVLTTAKQLVLLLLLPIGTGMGIRYRCPALVERHSTRLRRLSLAAIIALLGLVLYDQRQNLAAELSAVTVAAIGFTLLAMIAGFGTGWLLGLDNRDRFTLLTAFSCRSLAIAVGMAVTLLKQTDSLVFAAIFFLTQAALLLPAIGVFRYTLSRRPLGVADQS